MNTNLPRLSGALFALIMVAASCGSEATTQAQAEQTPTQDELDVAADPASDDHGDGHDDHHEDDDHHSDDENMDDETHEEGHDHAGTGEVLDTPIADADVVITISFDDGKVAIDDDRIEITRYSVVGLSITSDTAENIHVHGYDILGSVTPGESTELVFLADIPGVFEIEFESSVAFVTELVVR